MGVKAMPDLEYYSKFSLKISLIYSFIIFPYLQFFLFKTFFKLKKLIF